MILNVFSSIYIMIAEWNPNSNNRTSLGYLLAGGIKNYYYFNFNFFFVLEELKIL